MYAFQNNILSIPARLLYGDWKVVTYEYYKKLCARGKLQVTQAGKGQGNEAWVAFESLPVVKGVNVKEFCVRMLGKPEEAHIVTNVLEEYIVPDPEAINFFAEHRKPNGKSLPLPQQREKATSAMILGAIETLLKSRPLTAKAFGKRKTQIWQNISEAVNALNPEKWSFSLPNNPRSLQRKYNQYLT